MQSTVLDSAAMKIKLNGEITSLKHMFNKETLADLIKAHLLDQQEDDKTYDDFSWGITSEIINMRLEFNTKA